MVDCLSDAELMERIRDHDDADAFAQLVCRWRPRLAGYFSPLLGDAAAVDDAVQDLLIALWTSRADYRATGRFAAFVLRRAEHHWLNLRRREARRATEPLDQVPEPPAVDAALAAQQREAHRRLVAATATLPAHERDVLRLVAEQHLPERIAADQLGVPLGTIKSRLHAARRRLRAVLQEMDDV